MAIEKDRTSLLPSIIRLEETVKNITLEIQDVKVSILKLQEQDLKRHDEVRESYYVAETTRKRHEEIRGSCLERFNQINENLKEIKDSLDKHEQEEIDEEKEADREKHKTFLTIIKYLIIAGAAIVAGVIGGDLGNLISLIVKRI